MPDDTGGNIEAFETAVPKLGRRPYLLFLSRIHPKKGCDLIIRSFAAIAARWPGVDLVIAGPDQIGWRTELEMLAADLNIKNRVHWAGMLSGGNRNGHISKL